MKFPPKNIKLVRVIALVLGLASIACYIPSGQFLVFILLGLVLIQNRKSIDFRLVKSTPFIFLFCYVIWGYITIFYSSNTRFATHQIEKSIPLLMLSLVAFSYKIKGLISFDRVQKIYFLVSISILSIFSILLLYGFIAGNVIRNGESLFSSQIDAFLSVNHRTYFSVSLMMVFPYLYEQISKPGISIAIKLGYALSALMIFTYIFLAGSRSALLSIVVLIIFYSLVEVKKRLGKQMLFLPIVLILILGAVFSKTPRVEKAIYMVQHGYSFESVFTRVGVWGSAVRVFEENKLLGVGIGDFKDALALQYKADDKDFYVERQFNCHNQYLQILVERGIIGGFLFLAFFLVLIYKSDRRKYIYTWSFVIVYATSFLFESMLNRNIGVIPFVYWIFILFVYRSNTDDREDMKSSKWEVWVMFFFIISSFVWLLGFSIGKAYNSLNPNTYLSSNFEYIEHNRLPLVDRVYFEGDGALFNADNIVLKKHPNGAFMSTNIRRLAGADSDPRDSVLFTCWCFVSEDANVKHCGIYAYEPPRVYEDAMFNLNVKGEWQQLLISSELLERGVDFGLNISMSANEKLEGYVIFSNPHFTIK